MSNSLIAHEKEIILRRAEDWMKQAEYNLDHAEGSLKL
jgi:hypothetical protein